jgi:hypothetical protein
MLMILTDWAKTYIPKTTGNVLDANMQFDLELNAEETEYLYVYVSTECRTES